MADLFNRGSIVSLRQLMCTVSFLPTPQGFFLTMNRDEKRTRAAALAPTVSEYAQRHAVFPIEPSGGTWIAANDAGVCVALLNWHRIKREPAGEILSRGEVPRMLARTSSAGEIANTLDALPLEKIRPFRVIALVASEQNLTEWQWNLENLIAHKCPWKEQHWFSSGFNELQAESERQRVCESSHGQGSSGRLAWLRRLHRSHEPERGPFSICMHRPDAATVSYTEVVLEGTSITMRYQPGPPCKGAELTEHALPLRPVSLALL